MKTKTIKIVTEFEVPEDFDDLESLVMYMDAAMSSADYTLLEDHCGGAEVGISYLLEEAKQ